MAGSVQVPLAAHPSTSSAPSTIDLDRVPVAVLHLELDGSVAGHNPAAERLLGLEGEPLTGRAGPQLLQLPEAVWQAMRAVTDGELVAEVTLVRRNEATPIHVVASAIRHGERALIQVVALEVVRPQLGPRPPEPPGSEGERGRNDEAGLAKQRLESLGLVAGGIAHDFNNLLVGVLAEASAAREDPRLGEETREALRRIEAAAGRMSQLTKQLLAYSGRGRFVTARLDPDLLVGALREQLARIVEPPAAVEVVATADGAVVEADASLLRQVVINLVANARDAGAQRVQVATRTLSRDNAPWWQLEVSDDGSGIDAETLARIFDPFFSTKPDRHGLGLSAVHGIVRRLGGDVEVDSRIGEGARFRVRLPIVSGALTAPPSGAATTQPIRRLTGLRVLVADDEPSVRATVRRLLERRGATVVVAADGLEAQGRLQDERFDLVVLDVQMPGCDGYDVLTFARAVRPDLPVILMSGYTERVRGEGGEEEPDAFIEKPFSAKQLDAAIDEVLRARLIGGGGGDPA